MFQASLWLALAVMLLHMHLACFIALKKEDNSVADIAWGLGFVFIAWSTLMFNQSFNWQALASTILVTLWGLRLAWHIWLRNRNKPEDWRYKKWREDWGKNWKIRTYFQVFLLQGFIMLVIALPIIYLNSVDSTGWQILDTLGVLLWLLGFVFEAVGDYQLYLFKQDPERSGVMKTGLWRYTRHPNYFGEATLWWGNFLLALNLSQPLTLLLVAGPATIDWMLLKVSGIPMLEKRYEGDQDYQQYKQETNAFFPWFPQKGDED